MVRLVSCTIVIFRTWELDRPGSHLKNCSNPVPTSNLKPGFGTGKSWLESSALNT